MYYYNDLKCMSLPDYPLASSGIKEGCGTVTDKTAIQERRKVEESTLLKRVGHKGEWV
jgi:hypothetical protein